MKTYDVNIAVQFLEVYLVEAEDAEEAAERWSDGDLIRADDEVLRRLVLSVEEA